MPNTKYTKLPRGLVVISGSDSNTFLQGLISQNVNKVTQKKAAYSALLTPQGKFLHDFCISKIGNNLILDCEQGREEELISNISKFKLRAKVELKHEKELSVFSVFGDEASQSLHLSNILGASREIKNGIAFVDPRKIGLGCRIIAPESDTIELLEDLSIKEGTFIEYDTIRLSLCIPDGTKDLLVNKSVLLEANFDELHGIDWEKGCYIGQEVTARSKFRGLLKRRLVTVSYKGPSINSGTPILLNGKEVGTIKSSVDGLSLAMLRLDALEESCIANPLTSNGIVISRFKSFDK